MSYRFPLLPFPNLIIWKPTHDFWMANRGDAIFDYKEGDARERRFLFYDYDEPTHFYEYMQTGYAGDVDTMYFTGVEITP